MKRILYVLLVILTVPLLAQERITLTTPVSKPTQTRVELERITIDVKAKSVYVQWLGENGEAGSAVYATPGGGQPVPTNACTPATTQPTGAAVITMLNTANLTNNSLVKRVLTRLQTDCYLPTGTIGGTPE